jgi:hypothetical protein
MNQGGRDVAVRPRVVVVGTILVVIVLLVMFEVVASMVLLYRYRTTGAVRDGESVLSTLVFSRKALAVAGLARPPEPYEIVRMSRPAPFLREDGYFGYAADPGEYRHTYWRRRKLGRSEWETLSVKVTIDPDGARWTGRDEMAAGRPGVYVLGDSFAFGTGVHDEQTFAYHLQMAAPEIDVRLHALGGYGLAQSYLRFLLLREDLSERDIIVIAYADFYDVRNVAAPSRLRDIARWSEKVDPAERIYRQLPRAHLSPDGVITIDLIAEDCAKLGEYCAMPDPTPEYMTSVSAALINAIATGTVARVYVLAMDGQMSNRVYGLLNEQIEVIPILPEQVEFFARDDIVGFDPHPGPYWHYGVARELIDRLNLAPKP